MTVQGADAKQSPLVVGLLGGVGVALALMLPISVPDPDGPKGVTVKCGNAVHLATGTWNFNDRWRQQVHDACTDKRITRVAEGAGVGAAALFVATFLIALPPGRRRRNAMSDDSAAAPS